MAKIGFTKEQLEGNVIPDGQYDLRLEGFEPEFSKKKDSINLNPVLKVVNHMTLNGKRVYDNLNSGASWINEAFGHAFGFALEPDGSGGATLPGEFMGPDDDPENWDYVGPLKGAVGKAMVKQTTYNSKVNSKIDQWLCSLGPNCNTKHPTDLAK